VIGRCEEIGGSVIAVYFSGARRDADSAGPRVYRGPSRLAPPQTPRARGLPPPWVAVEYLADRRRLSRGKADARDPGRADPGDLGLRGMVSRALNGMDSLITRRDPLQGG